MAITVKHTKVSSIPDGDDSSLIRPSDWNQDHTLIGLGTMAEQDANNVAITGGTISGVSGIGTVTSVAATAGTGISVTGSPITSSGTLNITNTAPDQVVSLTGAGTTSISGTYPNFTITSTGGSGGGDVSGPASATDNAITRFDGTTGKIIQNSTVIIDDNGNASGVNAITFDTTPATTPTDVGSMYWNTSDGTLDLIMRGGTVVQQIGEEQYYTVRNQTGSTIANGTPVMANGVTAGSARITVTPAIADGSIDEIRFIGLTTESISNGINGYVTSFGYVRGLDTRGDPYGETWAEGDVIYVSPTTAGYLTNVEPTAPNLKIVVAIVITRNQTSGVLFVRPTAYPHITHLSDVQITTPASGNLLIYDATQSRWENANLTDGTGISITEGAGSVTIANSGVTQATAGTGISVSSGTGNVTITNSAPDQTVALTAGTGISTSGTYPNFTITNTAPSLGGTVTSITAGTGLSGGTITSSGTIAIDSTVATLTGTQTLTNKTLTSPTLTTATTSGKFTFGGAIDETVFAVSGTTPALSPTNGTIQTWTLSANSTPTAGTWDAGESMTMMIADGTAYEVVWSSVAVTWVGGTAPTLATTGYTVIELWKVGSTIYGATVGDVA